MREHEQVKEFAKQDIINLVQNTDLSDINTFLVLNGGTGVGKTTAIMTEVLDVLCKKFNPMQSMLVVESRTVTVEQLRHKYGEVDVCQRIRLADLIKKNQVDYNWVVIDECHGLFSEAGFATDTTIIGEWIRSGRSNQHIIFITANDEYFDELSKQYFSDDCRFIYLFPDFTKYVSNTYVKEIQFIKTKNTNQTLDYFIKLQQNKRGIIFLKSASKVKDYYFRLLDEKIGVAMLVSRANQTALSLNDNQQEIAKQNAILDMSEGRSGLTLADLQNMADKQRIVDGKESLFEALAAEHLPSDISILIVTDTLQEGMSLIFPKIDYMIIDGYSEVEIRQKVGRFRGNLDQLFIIFNPASANRNFLMHMEMFGRVRQMQKDGDQIGLAKLYGQMQGAQMKLLYVTEEIKDGEKVYRANEQAYLNLLYNHKDYLRLMGDTETAIKEMYSYLGTTPLLLDSTIASQVSRETALKEIAERWKGIPLKGTAQEALIQEMQSYKIVDKQRKPITSFRGCLAALTNIGITIETKQASKKDLELWPQYLVTLHEKFRYIL